MAKNMIDNYETTVALIKELENALPIMANPTKRLVHGLKEQGKKIKPYENLKIINVMYMGDDGGISCEIVTHSEKQTAFIVSLSHLALKSSHPLYKQVKAYQLARIKGLAKQNSLQFRA